jgi:6-phosphogluconolactonase/glucosamine-6-phosphate isomerase/deaminase
MKTTVFETSWEAARYAADTAAQILAEKPSALFCLAAGHSSLPFFKALTALRCSKSSPAAKLHQLPDQSPDFSRARFVELDEWLDLPRDTAGSCALFLQSNFFSKINAKKENICLFDPLTRDGKKECRRVTDQIAAWGGIDYLLLGMGLNGHLALNEPGSDPDCPARVTDLSKTTLEVAPKYFGGAMPPITRGLTLGLADLKAARVIQLLVLGEHKREICGRLLSCKKPDIDLPVSALLESKQAELIVDRATMG